MINQRSTQQETATVAGNGTIAFTFSPPPAGYTLTGTVTVIDASNLTDWTVGIGNNGVIATPLATGHGATPIGDIQCMQNESIVVTSTGLPVGNVYHAIYLAALTPDSDSLVVIPGTTAQEVTTAGAARLVASGLTSIFPKSIPINLQPGDRSLIIAINNGAGLTAPYSIALVGGTTGINWDLAAAGTKSLVAAVAAITVPIYGSIDPTATVTISTTGTGSTRFWILAVPDENLVLSTIPALALGQAAVPFNLNCLSGATTPIVAAPLQGNLIIAGVISLQNSVALTGVGFIDVRGATTGIAYGHSSTSTANLAGSCQYLNVVNPVNEGLSVFNSSGQTIGVSGGTSQISIS
jgi:hypothetical protein